MLNGSVFGQRFYAARNPPRTANSVNEAERIMAEMAKSPDFPESVSPCFIRNTFYFS